MKTAHTAKIPFLLGLFMVLLTTAPCPAQQEKSRDVVLPKIKMDNVPVPDAIKHLARQAQLNVIVDPRVISDTNIPPVAIAFENITAKEALDKILKIRRLERIENPATTVSRIVPEKLGIKPVDPELLRNDTNAVIPIILMEEVPLGDALINLAHQIRLNLTFDQKLAAAQSIPVSLRWNDITGKQALIALLDDYDLIMVEDTSGGTARITVKQAPPKSP
jgi:hypothetical protein